MTHYTRHRRFAEAQEAFNRASHSDALREMQLEPAEQPMPLVGYRPHWSLYAMAFGLTIILTVVGVSS